MSKTNAQAAACPLPVRRVALYARVSTEEQARHGFSIEAQLDNLHEWAKQNGHTVAGVYIDNGVSARKPAAKRPELQRLLADLDAKQIELIAFTKLDRWFRNVREYHKTAEILDAHGVAWQAVQEDYETVTATGRFKVNIMLAVAEDEADRTSERIKTVFENKVTRGEVITGKTPIGYRIENKHLVPDEQADIARDMFRHYETHGSTLLTMRYMRDTYNLPVHQHTIAWALRNTIYKGEYRGNPNYCEPLIPVEEFETVQRMLEKRSSKVSPVGRVFLFSGLLTCSVCGHAMTVLYAGCNSKRNYAYYRCSQYAIYHHCEHKASVSEYAFEKWLLENISAQLEEQHAKWLMTSAEKPKSMVDRTAILRKLDKLKDLYVNDLITMEQYRADYDRYNQQLAKAAEETATPAPDYERLRSLLAADFQQEYEEYTREERRIFWHSIIEKIELDVDNTPTIYFK